MRAAEDKKTKTRVLTIKTKYYLKRFIAFSTFRLGLNPSLVVALAN
jgi:hypothetical protein